MVQIQKVSASSVVAGEEMHGGSDPENLGPVSGRPSREGNTVAEWFRCRGHTPCKWRSGQGWGYGG